MAAAKWAKMLARIDDRLILLELAARRPGITIIHRISNAIH